MLARREAPEYRQIAGWHVAQTPQLAMAACHIPEHSADTDMAELAYAAYDTLFALQHATGLADTRRVWHIVSDVLTGDGEAQRYRQSCRGRAVALAGQQSASHEDWHLLPPATLVGGPRPGLWILALLGAQAVEPIENPRQVSAYAYPAAYATSPPAFARAGIVTAGNARDLLISGTASIVGHKSRYVGDVRAQFEEALANLVAVIEAARPSAGSELSLDQLASLKIYVRDPQNAAALLERAGSHLPDVPMAALAATVCRDDLLVELEAHLCID